MTEPGSRLTRQDTVYVTYIATTPERLWAALTGPEFTRQYFFGRAIESTWRVGAELLYRLPDGRVDLRGTILVCDPPRQLTFRFTVEGLEAARALPPTEVTYLLEPLGEVVRLTLTEAHPEPIPEAWLEGGRRGWPVILSGLKSLLEMGRVPHIPPPGPPPQA